jgi:hypothetical protein
MAGTAVLCRRRPSVDSWGRLIALEWLKSIIVTCEVSIRKVPGFKDFEHQLSMKVVLNTIPIICFF